MCVPVITFINCKGAAGRTSLVYHLAWMYAEMGIGVVAADLDPQADLTGMFLEDARLESLWVRDGSRHTVYGALEPVLKGTGDIRPAHVESPGESLFLIAGDLLLSSAEEELSIQWEACLDGSPRGFLVTSALWRILQGVAVECGASVILADVGPNLGALNRSVMVATDHVVVPLVADMSSLLGLRSLGPALQHWRVGWRDRHGRSADADVPLPEGSMQPIGYVVRPHGAPITHPGRADDRWVSQVPREYATNLLGVKQGPYPASPDEDRNSLATVKHYRSLVPMAQQARKPIFRLTVADGALGGLAASTTVAHKNYRNLALNAARGILEL